MTKEEVQKITETAKEQYRQEIFSSVEIEEKDYLNLPEMIDSWLSYQPEIVSVKGDYMVLLVVTRETVNLYRLYRFFKVGGKWVCSVDVKDEDSTVIINKLMQSVEL